MNSKIKEIFMYTLGALIALGTFSLIGMLIMVVYRHPESVLKDTLILAVGSLLAAFGLVVGYFYGSSKGSSDKSDAINKQMNNGH